MQFTIFNSYGSLRLGLPLLGLFGLGAGFSNSYAAWLPLLGLFALWLLALPFFYQKLNLASHKTKTWVDLLFFDLGLLFAKALKLEEMWVDAYRNWNNAFVLKLFAHNKASKSIVLLPHCIQWSSCDAPILDDVMSCYNCGKCSIEDLISSKIINKWDAHITNRSYKAYQATKASKPDLIVAVSCNDRLIKGIRKLPDYPAYLIPLSLPYGMCVDADFSMVELEDSLRLLAQPKKSPFKESLLADAK